MICDYCRQAADTRDMSLHAKCKGCPCQHRAVKRGENGQGKTQRGNQEKESAGNP